MVNKPIKLNLLWKSFRDAVFSEDNCCLIAGWIVLIIVLGVPTAILLTLLLFFLCITIVINTVTITGLTSLKLTDLIFNHQCSNFELMFNLKLPVPSVYAELSDQCTWISVISSIGLIALITMIFISYILYHKTKQNYQKAIVTHSA